MSFSTGVLLLDRYEIERELGSGGMGAVYLALDKSTGRQVALKRLNEDRLSNDAAVVRFKREFKAMKELSHPNIVEAYELHSDEDAELMFLTMEYVRGKPLSEIIYDTEYDLDFEEGFDYLNQVARGLNAAHSKGFTHRDLKPENVLISEEGTAKLVDFGLVAHEHNNLDLTQSTDTVGTLYYMSPEQFRALGVDKRTDIYSLGILAFEIFARQRPYDGDMPFNLFVEHALGSIPPIRKINPNIPDWVEIYILISVEKEPEHRYQSVEEILELFEDKKGRPARPSLFSKVRSWVGA